MIRAIIFDFYGVFLPDTYNEWLSLNGLVRRGVFADLITKLDKNKINETEFLTGLSEVLKRTVARSELFNQSSILDEAVVQLVQDLRVNYKIALLSNASIKLRTKLENFGISTIFDHIIISAEIGHAKPSDASFSAVLESLDLKASQVLFVDDNPINTTAASKIGITSIVYRSLPDLEQALQSNGITINGDR